MQAWTSGLHYHHEIEAYFGSFALNMALNMAPKSGLLYFDEDIEMAEKLMVDAKLKRRGKTRRVSRFCTSPSEFLPKYYYKHYACLTTPIQCIALFGPLRKQ